MKSREKQNVNNDNMFSLSAIQIFADAISDMGVLVVDMDNRIVVYNSAASYYDRMDKKTAIGMHYYELYCDEDGGLIKKVKQSGKSILNTIQEYKYADGTKMSSIDSIYPIYIEGNMEYILAFTKYNIEAQGSLQKAFDFHSVKNKKNKRKGMNGARYSFDDILGKSDAIRETVRKAMRASTNFAPVFIEGETGTGKELFAQSIHNEGIGIKRPFVAINCAAIPENLLEGMLFGTTKGAFTGAENKAGLFEQAKDGTFFLDEINSMPLLLQAKLLRVLQERKVRRIGANEEIDIMCRIISSCNQNAEHCIEEGILRNDLYYRLSVIKIDIPSLRDRKEDIDIYAEAFINKFSKAYGRIVEKCSPEFYDALRTYDWPGNVRELEHVIESSVVMLNKENKLSLSDLPSNIVSRFVEKSDYIKKTDVEETEYEIIKESEDVDIKDYLFNRERELLIEKLEENDWNITHTANVIGISRSNLQYRLRKFNIEKPK